MSADSHLSNRQKTAVTSYATVAKNKESVEDIVNRHLPLVKSIVGKIKMRLPDHIEFNDPIQRGGRRADSGGSEV